MKWTTALAMIALATSVASCAQTVPVSGTVNVGNLPAVQTVTGTVAIDKLPTVVVADGTTVRLEPSGGPLPVVDVTKKREPFQVKCSYWFKDGSGVTDDASVSCWPLHDQDGLGYTVPVGRRLVVEHVSLLVSIVSGQKPTYAEFSGCMRKQGVEFALNPQPLGASDGLFVANERILAFVDGGCSFGGKAGRAGKTGGGWAQFSVTGYLVDCPSCVATGP